MQRAVLRLDIDAAWDVGEVTGGRVVREEVGRQQVGWKRGRNRVSQRRGGSGTKGHTETLGERQEEETHREMDTHQNTRGKIQHCLQEHWSSRYTPSVGIWIGRVFTSIISRGRGCVLWIWACKATNRRDRNCTTNTWCKLSLDKSFDTWTFSLR